MTESKAGEISSSSNSSVGRNDDNEEDSDGTT